MAWHLNFLNKKNKKKVSKKSKISVIFILKIIGATTPRDLNKIVTFYILYLFLFNDNKRNGCVTYVTFRVHDGRQQVLFRYYIIIVNKCKRYYFNKRNIYD